MASASSGSATSPLGVGLIGAAAADRSPVLVPDVRRDHRYIPEHTETRSELAVPLVYKGRVIGVIDLEHTKVNYYNEDHQRTLMTLASQVAISLVNARLYQRIHDEEQRMERDLGMAREVQIRLLPQYPPVPAHAEIAASFSAARSIGGDLYDFLDYGPAAHPDLEDPDAEESTLCRFPRLSELRTMIALGDVSGKAAPAALYAALVSGILRSLGSQQLQPCKLLEALNDQLQERKLDAQYVTMLAALWDDSNRTLTVANAGSVQPMVVRRGSSQMTAALDVTTLPVEGFPLGLFPHATYDETCLRLSSGDLVLFFSDGIIDAVNSRGEQFGEERLAALLQQHPTANLSAQGAVDAVLEAVTVHQSGTEHFDDETIVAVRVR